MEKRGIYVLIGICAFSALLGIGLGYFIFGPMGFLAKETEPEYEAFQKYVPPPEPEVLLAYSDIPFIPTPADSPDLSEASIPTEEIEPLYRFLVTSLDGYIVVYHITLEGQSEIIEITSTLVNALPLIEQHRLAQGIRIYTEEALIRILEDYGS